MSDVTKSDGVRDALNAVALGNNETKAFFYERVSRSIVHIDALEGKRTTFKLDKGLQRQRWLCYCLFYWFPHNSSSESAERLSILWYNLNKKRFCFTTHRIASTDDLSLIGDKVYLPIDVPYDRLGYSAQNKHGRVEVVFYELKSPSKQKFWLFEYDMRDIKINRSRNGVLPSSSSHWEVPFLTDRVTQDVMFFISATFRGYISSTFVRVKAS